MDVKGEVFLTTF